MRDTRLAALVALTSCLGASACGSLLGIGDLPGLDGSAGVAADSGGVTEDGSSSDGSSTSSSSASSSSGSSGSSSGGALSSGGSSSGGSSGGGDDGGSSSGSSGSGDANQDACTPNGTGAVGILRCPCSGSGSLACNGNAQKLTLICSGGTWASNGTCGSGQLCDSAVGVNQGTCQSVDPNCTNASPGDDVCSNAMTAVVRCGPDLVSDSPIATCTNQACVNAACTGVCTPGATQCSTTCNTLGCTAETCSMVGQWGAATMCPGGQCGSGQPGCCPCD